MSLSAADRLAILEVVTRADEAASRRDADGYVALFAPDAVLDGTQGRHAGREELRASVGPIWPPRAPLLYTSPSTRSSSPARAVTRPSRGPCC
jgi:hypothetical protein